MKKISIVLAILAVFLVFSCSNAAGPVDNAGNPVDLAGSWSGTVAWKVDQVVSAPAIFTNVYQGTMGGIDYYQDYQGTWVKEAETSKADKDYEKVETEVTTSGTMTTTETVTTKYIFDEPTITTTVTRVINADGSYTDTTVVTKEYPARAAISAVNQVTSATATTTAISRTNYVVKRDGVTTNYNNGTFTDTPAGGTVAAPVFNNWEFAIPAYLGGKEVETTTTTVTVTAQDDGLYTETTSKTVAKEYSGDLFNATVNKGTPITAGYTVETYPDAVVANISKGGLAFDNLDSTWKQTVIVPAKQTVTYQDDMAETITFEVKADGTYTLTVVDVLTQAAADAAAETETHYAAPARAASTSTTTYTIKGTVAAWEVPATANDAATTKMVLSSSSSTYEVAGTGDFESTTTPSVSLFGAGDYTIRFFQGEGKKGETILTRMYVDLGLGNIVILDKAVETEEE